MGGCALRVYTIGFTKISASDFFEILKESGAKRLWMFVSTMSHS